MHIHKLLHWKATILADFVTHSFFRWVYYNVKPFMAWVLKQTFAPWLRLKMYFHGINRHSIGEVSEMTFKDLKAISDIMARNGKKYLFDTEKPTSFDCALFGHLAQVLDRGLLFIYRQPFQKYTVSLAVSLHSDGLPTKRIHQEPLSEFVGILREDQDWTLAQLGRHVQSRSDEWPQGTGYDERVRREDIHLYTFNPGVQRQNIWKFCFFSKLNDDFPEDFQSGACFDFLVDPSQKILPNQTSGSWEKTRVPNPILEIGIVLDQLDWVYTVCINSLFFKKIYR